MRQVKETIKIGELELNFLLDGNDTNDGMVLFESIIPPGAKVPVPHYHTDVDEVVFGLEGITTSTLNGKKIDIGPGDRLFIPKGAVHHHENLTQDSAKSIIILTPASIGPEYFREMAALIKPGIPVDFKKASEIMTRYGLIPAAYNNQ